MAKDMRILFMTYDFPPINHSGTFRSEAFAKYLPQFGIVPTVVCSAKPLETVPNYLRTHEGCTNCQADMDIIRINWRQRPTLYRSISAFLQKLPVINTLTRLIDHHYYLRHFAIEIITKTNGSKYSAVYASSPPNDTILIATHISRLLELPLICDLRDPWTYFPGAQYRSYLDFLIARYLEKSILNSASQVIANTQASKSQLIRQIGVNPRKITVIPNGYDSDSFSVRVDDKILDDSKFNITYTGLISPSNVEPCRNFRTAIKNTLGLDYAPVQVDYRTRSPKYVLKALELLIESEPSFFDTIRFHIVGKFEQQLIDEIAQFRYNKCVQVHGPVDQIVANKLCMDSDLLLLLQISTKISGHPVYTAVPGKTYNYLRSGTWILAAMEENEASEIIRNHAAGDIVPPRDVDAIAQSMHRHIKRWKAYGKRDVGQFNEEIEKWDCRVLTSKLAERIADSVH